MKESILLIQSKEDNNNHFGTGFIIHQDEFGSYVLTCSHVVNSVEKPMVNGKKGEIKADGKDKGIDLAILYVKNLYAKPLLLQNINCDSTDTYLFGYSDYNHESYQSKKKETILLEEVVVTLKDNSLDIDTWQIMAKENYIIAYGNSGSPLVCKESNKVIGVVSDREGEEDAYSIFIKHIEDIWKDIPPLLFKTPYDDKSPFIGLNSFSIEEAHLFFGREKEINTIFKKLKKSNLVTVVGDSGSGKSSLIKAGVIPRYLNGEISDNSESSFHLLDIRPTQNPFQELARKVSQIDKVLNLNYQDFTDTKEDIASENIELIVKRLAYIFREEASYLLIYIDQFEEIFTLTNIDTRNSFMAMLTHLLTSPLLNLKIKILLTVRSDYYNLIYNYKTFAILVNESGVFTVRRMSNSQIKDCIVKPLRKTSIKKEEIQQFAENVVNDMGDEPSELALLQIALTQTYNERKNSENLWSAYLTVQKIKGALDNLATNTIQVLPFNEKELLKYIFIRLVKFNENESITRRLVHKDEFSEVQWKLSQKLASVIIDENKILGRLLKVKDNVVELIHESLITQWIQYQVWIDEVRVDNLKNNHDILIQKTQIFLDKKKARKFLLIGDDLKESSKLLKKSKKYLSNDEIKFIQKSQWNKRFKIGLIFIFFSSLLLLGYTLYESKKQRLIEENLQRDIQQGIYYRDSGNPLKSKLIFAKILSENKNIGEFHNLNILYNSVQHIKLTNILESNSSIYGLIQSKNMLISWEKNNTITTWNKDFYKKILPLHKSNICSVRVMNDGLKIISWNNWNINIFDILNEENSKIKTKEKLSLMLLRTQLAGSLEPLPSSFLHCSNKTIEITKDENQILFWTTKSINIYDLESRLELLNIDIKKEYGSLNGIHLSPDETEILSWTNNRLIVWDKLTGKEKFNFKYTLIGNIKYNTNGDKIILSREYNGKKIITILDNKNMKEIFRLDFNFYINGIQFTKDEKNIIIWLADGTVKMVRIKDKKELFSTPKEIKPDYHMFDLGGRESETTGVRGIVLTKNNKEILIWKNKIITLWDLRNNTKLLELKHNLDVNQAMFSKDETKILTWSWDGSVRVWDKKTGREQLRLKHKDLVTGILNDSNKIFTWSLDKTIKVWEKDTISNLVTVLHLKGENISFYEKKDSFIYNKKDNFQIINFLDSKEKKVDIFTQYDKAVENNSLNKYPFLDDILLKYGYFNQKKDLILGYTHKGFVEVWKKDGTKIFKLKHNLPIKKAIFSSSEKKVISWTDSNIRVSNLNFKKNSVTLREKGIQGATLNKKENLLLTWSNNKVVLWNLKNSYKLLHIDLLEPIKYANFDSSESYIIMSNDKETKAFEFLKKGEVSSEYSFLEAEVNTGVTLSDLGTIEVLSSKEWKDKKEKLEEKSKNGKNTN